MYSRQFKLIQVQSIGKSFPYSVTYPVHTTLLEASIAATGFIAPIEVQETNAGYQCVSGMRRVLACRNLQITQIPAYILTESSYAPDQLLMCHLWHNAAAGDFNEIEKARVITFLFDSQNQIQ